MLKSKSKIAFMLTLCILVYTVSPVNADVKDNLNSTLLTAIKQMVNSQSSMDTSNSSLSTNINTITTNASNFQTEVSNISSTTSTVNSTIDSTIEKAQNLVQNSETPQEKQMRELLELEVGDIFTVGSFKYLVVYKEKCMIRVMPNVSLGVGNFFEVQELCKDTNIPAYTTLVNAGFNVMYPIKAYSSALGSMDKIVDVTNDYKYPDEVYEFLEAVNLPRATVWTSIEASGMHSAPYYYAIRPNTKSLIADPDWQVSRAAVPVYTMSAV